MRALFFLIISISPVFAESIIDSYEKASVTDRDFLSKSFEAGKEYLNHGQVEKALTISLFYRTNFLRDQKMRMQYFQEGFYQLEVLSLIKLCQWNHIDPLMDEYKETLGETKGSNAKLEELRKQINQNMILQETLKDKNSLAAKETENFQDLVIYKVPYSILESAAHPKDFILKIDNKCLRRF